MTRRDRLGGGAALDNLAAMRRLDPSGMLAHAEDLASQCLDGWKRGLSWSVPAAPAGTKGLLILGMGGSAIGGDLLAGLLQGRLRVPVVVSRSYDLPRWAGRGVLVLVCSYSGNTEETLSAAAQARAQGARMVAISSGGKLAEFSRKNRIPFLRIPAGIPPRAAVGYSLFAPLGLLSRLGWIRKVEIPVEAALSALGSFIRNRLAAGVPGSSNPAKRLAGRLKGRLPILYGASPGWEAVAYRWRTQLEENAKTLAFHHLFPEATHNEISGWVEPRPWLRKSAALFLTDPSLHPRTLKRMEFARRIVAGEGALALKVSVPGGSVLERALKMVTLGDFTSIYLAFLYGADPTPVERVEALKRYLSWPGTFHPKGARPL